MSLNRSRGALAILAFLLALAVGIRPLGAAMPAGNVVEVRMITTLDGASGIFKPAAVTVKRGDTVRFVTEGRTLHNVSFPPSENPGRTIPQQSPGPYLTAPDTFFDLSTASMEPGKYNFQCDPHAAMGMKGALTIR